MSIPSSERTRIFNAVLDYLRSDGMYLDSAQGRGKYFRSTFNTSASPFGTSGTHSCVDVLVDDIVHGITDYYSTSAADLNVGTLSVDAAPITGRCGIATMVNGAVIVPNTTITVNTLIFITPQITPPTGFLTVNKTPGTSFTITSTSPLDNILISWFMVEMSS